MRFKFRYDQRLSIATIVVVSGTIEDREILLLQRAHNKEDGCLWGIPGGKIEDCESSIDAATRELAEETGIVLRKEDLYFFANYIVRREGYLTYENICFFTMPLKTRPIVRISIEHESYTWTRLADILDGGGWSEKLIPGQLEAIRQYSQYSAK